MDTTYQIYLFVHLILTTKNRGPVLKKPLRNVLFGFLRAWGEKKLVRIINLNGVEDHLHFLIQIHPTQSLSQVVRALREDSSKWLEGNQLVPDNFEWDEGYAAYSVSPGSLKQVGEYIERQEIHHQTRTLDNELESMEKIRIQH